MVHCFCRNEYLCHWLTLVGSGWAQEEGYEVALTIIIFQEISHFVVYWL